MPDLRVEVVEQQDSRLGRQLVHDPRSRGFVAPTRLPAGLNARRSVAHRIYDPRPNPSQEIGNCTGVAECVMGNTRGNRVAGKVLTMADAVRFYTRATAIDGIPGRYPGQDAGSTGLAAAKAAVEAGIADRYEWYFGVDAVLDGLQSRTISIGAWWYADMFHPAPGSLLVRPTGGRVGGHQWTLRAHDVTSSRTVGQQIVEGTCWWGDYRYFRLTVDDLAALLGEGGDAHTSYRRVP